MVTPWRVAGNAHQERPVRADVHQYCHSIVSSSPVLSEVSEVMVKRAASSGVYFINFAPILTASSLTEISKD